MANFYITIRTLEKRLDIARHNVEIQRESLKIAEARFEGGTTSQRDVEQAKTVLAGTQATIPILDTQLRQTKNALSVLLGLPPNHLTEQLQAKDDIPAPPAQVAVGIPVDLLRRRPDVRAAEYNAAAQSAQIGVAKAQLFPAFSLTGNFGLLSIDVGKNALAECLTGATAGLHRPVGAVEHLQLRPDHQPGAGPGRPFQAVAHHLSEHRAQRPAGGGG